MDPTCNRGYPNIYSDVDVSTYVSRVGADSLKAAWIKTYVLSCLLCNRMSFYGVNINCPPGSGNTLQGVVGGGPSAGAKIGVAAATVAIPVVGSIIGFFAGIFAQHHEQAVAREQSTTCDVFNKYNSFADAVEPAIRQGLISVTDATTALQNGVASLLGELSTISNAAQENAGFGYGYGLRALQLFNTELVYPSLKPSLVTSLTSGTGGLVALGAAGAVGAKVLGVF